MNSWAKYGVAGLRFNDFQFSFEAPNDVRDEVRERLEGELKCDRESYRDFTFEDRMMEYTGKNQMEVMLRMQIL